MFDFQEYYSLLMSKNVDQASKYRIENVPKKLYKYVSLVPDGCEEHNTNCNKVESLNKSKLKGLEKSAIWMSRMDSLNDPFEHKAMYLNTTRLKERGYPEESIMNIQEYMNEMRKSYLVSSFTTEVLNNMPMWAHYANNHQGYCIELEVLEGSKVFPVSYEEARIPTASSITQLLSRIHMIENGEIDETDKDFQFYLVMFMHSAALKHKSWAYENEYRVLIPYRHQNDYGMVVPLKVQGLRTRAIYIGADCSRSNETKLRSISTKLDVPVYKMYMSDESENFELKYK